MVSVTREQVLNILEDYLDGKLTKENVFEWAHAIVISSEFDKIKDKLLSESMQVLWELHHEGKEEEFNPTREEIEYYRDCLRGKRKFEEE